MLNSPSAYLVKLKVEYLEHIVNGERVVVDLAKVECMKNWLVPQDLKASSSLGLLATIEDL